MESGKAQQESRYNNSLHYYYKSDCVLVVKHYSNRWRYTHTFGLMPQCLVWCLESMVQ